MRSYPQPVFSRATRTTTRALPDLGEGDAFGIAQSQGRRQLRPQNAILRGQMFILQQKLLVHGAGHIRQQSHPFRILHADRYLTVTTDGFGFFAPNGHSKEVGGGKFIAGTPSPDGR
jgi:hypothetical protein